MKNNKCNSTPPLIENENIINDPKEKSNIFNSFFASKSTVPNANDPAPNLAQKEGISTLSSLNTSPLEVAKMIRNLKKSNFSHCGLPGKFLGLISTPVSFSMSRLFNTFLKLDTFQINGKLLTLQLFIKDLVQKPANQVIAQFLFFHQFLRCLNLLCMIGF